MAASLPSLPPVSCGVPLCLSSCCLTLSFFKWDLLICFCLCAFFVTVPGLFLVVVSSDSLAVACRLLTVVASLVVELRL